MKLSQLKIQGNKYTTEYTGKQKSLLLQKSKLNEGIFGDALKSFARDPLDTKGNREAEGKAKELKDKFIRWSNQTQHSDDPNDIDLIFMYLETQMGFTKDQIKAIRKKLGLEVEADKDAEAKPEAEAEPDISGIFKDPAKFKAEWDKLLAADPKFRLLSDARLTSLLKTMWMNTGGTKVI